MKAIIHCLAVDMTELIGLNGLAELQDGLRSRISDVSAVGGWCLV